MINVRIDAAACKGCGLCTLACSKRILALDEQHLNASGYPPAYVTDLSACIACAMCAVMCPECAISVER
jgi:2-oxoglutarate ferredoxin oxidoreductase subunit delta